MSPKPQPSRLSKPNTTKRITRSTSTLENPILQPTTTNKTRKRKSDETNDSQIAGSASPRKKRKAAAGKGVKKGESGKRGDARNHETTQRREKIKNKKFESSVHIDGHVVSLGRHLRKSKSGAGYGGHGLIPEVGEVKEVEKNTTYMGDYPGLCFNGKWFSYPTKDGGKMDWGVYGGW